MQGTKGIPKQMVKKMNEAFFELLSEGVLSYQDPMIGPLANQEKQLVVLLNDEKARLELRLHGLVQEVFGFSDGIAQACRSAFHAYFTTFQSLCAERQRAVIAA